MRVRVCPQCGSVYVGFSSRCTLDDTPLVEQRTDPLVGRQLDRYRIEERLGIGGMGIVYRARHVIIDRSYAIKVLFGDYANNEKFQARFRREATSISKVRHPNIVQVEDFGRTQEGLTFQAMELVHGPTLEQLLADVVTMPAARVAHVARQIAEGLGAAHASGFVHRDVKPSNIMLARVPRPDTVKILDFGAVRRQTMPGEERLTAVGHLIGTPTYMAPEQSQNPGVGPTADVYALGVMMFEMLSGKPPFSGKSYTAIIVQHMAQAPPPLPDRGGLERLVAWMLRKRPEERPQSMRDVVAAIDRLQVGHLPAPRWPTVQPTPAGGEASSFHAAPTNQVLFGSEQAALRKIYADFEKERVVAERLSRDGRGDTPPDDTTPTPRDRRLPALATARVSSNDWQPLERGAPDAHLPIDATVAPSTLVVRQRNTALIDRPDAPSASVVGLELDAASPPPSDESYKTRIDFRFNFDEDGDALPPAHLEPTDVRPSLLSPAPADATRARVDDGALCTPALVTAVETADDGHGAAEDTRPPGEPAPARPFAPRATLPRSVHGPPVPRLSATTLASSRRLLPGWVWAAAIVAVLALASALGYVLAFSAPWRAERTPPAPDARR